MKALDHKSFPIEDVLSVITDSLLSPNGLGGVQSLLSYMTGELLFTTQIPNAIRVCGPVILEQHPKLKDVIGSWINQDNLQTWIDAQAAKYGRLIEIRPLISGWKIN